MGTEGHMFNPYHPDIGFLAGICNRGVRRRSKPELVRFRPVNPFLAANTSVGIAVKRCGNILRVFLAVVKFFIVYFYFSFLSS